MRYFEFSDFDSPDEEGSGKRYMDREFLEMLDQAREIAGVPFRIESGYRTGAHNRKVGGKPDSSHLYGLAADLKVYGSRERGLIVKALYEVGFNRIGISMGTLIHVDDDYDKDPDVM